MSLCGTKDNVKRKEGNDESNCLIGFLRGQFLDSKAKTGGIVLNILEIFKRLKGLKIFFPRPDKRAEKLPYVTRHNHAKFGADIIGGSRFSKEHSLTGFKNMSF